MSGENSVKSIYSEKAAKFCENSTLILSLCTVDKSKVEISQNFVAFSEYMNFKFISHANIRTLLKLQKCKGRLKHVFISSCTLSICTWFLKNRVWNLFSKIKLVEVDFLFISNLIFTACVACKNQVQNKPNIKFVQLDFWKKFQTRFFKKH